MRHVIIIFVAAALLLGLLAGCNTIAEENRPAPTETEPAERNEAAGGGPPSGNINNGGFVFYDEDGTLFFTNFAADGALYARLPDGELQMRSESRAFGIQRVGDWVYYRDRRAETGMGIARVRTDGSEREQLVMFSAAAPQVWDGWLYYINELMGSQLYRVQLDGTDAQRLHDDAAMFHNVTPRGIYYVSPAQGNGVFFMSHSGTSRRLVRGEFASNLVVANGWGYYIDVLRNLRRFDLDEGGGESDLLAAGVSLFQVDEAGEVIYVSGDAIWRLGPGDDEPQLLAEAAGISNLFISGGYIFYRVQGAENMMMIGMDGQEVGQLP